MNLRRRRSSNCTVFSLPLGIGLESLENRLLLTSGPFRINAGGSDFTDSNGDQYVADQSFQGGSFGSLGGVALTFNDPVFGTADDPLYQSVRAGGTPISYIFDDIDNGDYDVTVHFMQPDLPIFVVMDVAAEGVVQLDDFDVQAAAGDPQTAHSETFQVSVSDGQLSMQFAPLPGAVASVSAIEVVAAGTGGPTIFEDVAGLVGLELSHDLGDVCSPPPIGNGSAWADVDNDGDVDLFVTSRGGSNKLYRNDGDTTGDGIPDFTDVAASAGVAANAENSLSSVFIDYDNDGDQDLYVTKWGGNTLYENQLTDTGLAQFTDVTDFAGVANQGRGMTTAWADFDQDGYLDFYIGKHKNCGEDPESADALYRSNGDGTFDDVTDWLGPEGSFPQSIGLGFAPGWVDYDNDGDLDLYLANDLIDELVDYPNVLWRNDGPDGDSWVFTDVSVGSGANQGVNAMGLGVGDYNNDGWFDLAFSNIGKNYLLENQQDGTFADVSAQAGTRT